MKQLPAFFFLVFFLAHSATIYGQTKFSLGQQPQLKVTGTSTLHDWDMVSTTATGEAVLVMKDGELEDVTSLRVTMPAESIKSGKGGMDKRAYDALDTKANPTITYEISSIENTGDDSWTAEGSFEIAGVKQQARFWVRSKVEQAGVRFSGKYDFLLSDFGVEAPSAMMGTIKTGNEMTIHFDIFFNPTN